MTIDEAIFDINSDVPFVRDVIKNHIYNTCDNYDI